MLLELGPDHVRRHHAIIEQVIANLKSDRRAGSVRLCDNMASPTGALRGSPTGHEAKPRR